MSRTEYAKNRESLFAVGLADFGRSIIADYYREDEQGNTRHERVAGWLVKLIINDNEELIGFLANEPFNRGNPNDNTYLHAAPLPFGDISILQGICEEIVFGGFTDDRGDLIYTPISTDQHTSKSSV